MHAICLSIGWSPHARYVVVVAGPWLAAAMMMMIGLPVPDANTFNCICTHRIQGSNLFLEQDEVLSVHTCLLLGIYSHAGDWDSHGNYCTCVCCPSKTSRPGCSSICTSIRQTACHAAGSLLQLLLLNSCHKSTHGHQRLQNTARQVCSIKEPQLLLDMISCAHMLLSGLEPSATTVQSKQHIHQQLQHR